MNRRCHRRPVQRVFAAVSRLGDGGVWYLLMGLLPLIYGWQAWRVSLAMGACALFGVLCYKLLK